MQARPKGKAHLPGVSERKIERQELARPFLVGNGVEAIWGVPPPHSMGLC